MAEFTGPVFIVGSPRSGTKLLRDLLNEHPDIDVCNPETHFIPYLFTKHGGDAQRFEPDLRDLFADFNACPFQKYAVSIGKLAMTEADFLALDTCKTWSEFFEHVVRFYSPMEKQSAKIWGDKTPSYVRDIKVLKSIFPTVRFLHIVRDPRDIAASAKSAWGHSPLRTAAKWKNDMKLASTNAEMLGPNYFKVFFEDLIENSEQVLRNTCDFLDVPFNKAVLSLTRPSENLGTAQGETKIVHSNTGNFRSKLSDKQIKRIEEIAFDQLFETPYIVEHAIRRRDMSPVEAKALMVIDGLKSTMHHAKRKGAINAIGITLGNIRQKRRFHTSP